MPLPSLSNRETQLKKLHMRLVALEQTEELTARDRFENDEDLRIVGYLLARIEKRKQRIEKSRKLAGELEAMGGQRKRRRVA